MALSLDKIYKRFSIYEKVLKISIVNECIKEHLCYSNTI